MKRALLAIFCTVCIPFSTAIQPGAAPAQPAPLRNLPFGDINFLHTTDTHGWHAGHLLESSYSADWGDYVSFAEHLRRKLETEGKDLLLIDTGDRIEGNGLYDASHPRGLYTFDIFKRQQIDLLCSGNHELYKNSSANDDFFKLVPAYKDNYLASNLLIREPKTGELQPLAPTHRKFTTKFGYRIMSFGFLFDFTRNDKNTVVLPVEDVVGFPWFQDAIRDDEVDLFVVIGHVALGQQEFGIIHAAIREVNPHIPIQFFGGHFHVRDYRIFDKQSHALASGRFMETIGFQSISNVRSKSGHVVFSRRYIDNNLYSFYNHTNTMPSTFPTPRGRDTTQMIAQARSALDLDQTFGCAPQPFWMSRSPYPYNDSIYSLITDEIFPSIVNPERINKSRMLITNTGSIRFDIFAGPFTRDSTYIVSPFTSNVSFIPDVPYGLAKRLLPILNGADQIASDILRTSTFHKRFKFDLERLPPPEQMARNTSRVQTRSDSLRFSTFAPKFDEDITQVRLDSSTPLAPGYTTVDDLGSDGDDTIHSPIPSYDVPNCVQAVLPGPSSSIPNGSLLDPHEEPSTTPSSSSMDEEPIDLIFNEFLTPYVLAILNILPHLDPAYHGTLDGHEAYRTGLIWAFAESESLRKHNEASSNTGESETTKSYQIPPCVKLGLCEEEPIPTHIRAKFNAMRERESGESWGKHKEYARGTPVVEKLKSLSWIEEDVTNYVPGETFTSILANWVSENWKENCQDTSGGDMSSKEL